MCYRPLLVIIYENIAHAQQTEQCLPALYTHLSNVAAKMYFPFGENFTNDTGGLSSSNINKRTVSTQTVVKAFLNTNCSTQLCSATSKIYE